MTDTWTVLVLDKGTWRTAHEGGSFAKAIQAWIDTGGKKRFQRNGRSLPITTPDTDQPDLFQEAS